MTRHTLTLSRITDAIIATFALAAASAILVPVILVAVVPFAG